MLKIVGCVVLMCMLLVCSCSENQDKKLVGRWQEVGNPLGRLEFRSDHTGRAYWPNEQGKQESEDMKWVLLKGGDKVSVITPPGLVTFEIKNDRLISPNGVALVKVK